MVLATHGRSRREHKVVETERAGMKSGANSEAEKESLGREPEVRMVRKREGPT